MLRNIIFSLDFCYFKDISDEVTADDDVIFNILCWLLFVIFCNWGIVVVYKILEYCSIILIISFNSWRKWIFYYANAGYFEKQQKKQ